MTRRNIISPLASCISSTVIPTNRKPHELLPPQTQIGGPQIPPPSEAPPWLRGYHTSPHDYATEDNTHLHRMKTINDDPLVLTMIVIEEDTLLPYDDANEDAKLHFPAIMIMADPLLYPAL